VAKELGHEITTLQQQLNGTYEGPDRNWEDVGDKALWALETALGLPVAEEIAPQPPPRRESLPNYGAPQVPSRKESLPGYAPPVPQRRESIPPVYAPPPRAPPYVPRAPYRQPDYYVTSKARETNFGGSSRVAFAEPRYYDDYYPRRHNSNY